jgi:hypothetical protein
VIPSLASTGIDGGVGGCISSTARSRLERTTLDGCTSGLDASGAFASLDLVNSTVWGGRATTSTGGLFAEDAVIANSTITANTHSGGSVTQSDGLYTLHGAQLDSTIIHGNGTQSDLGGGPVTGAHDLIGAPSIDVPPGTLSVDPHLGPLADNGGHVPTTAPAAGSIAINRGGNPLGLASDARGNGFVRVADGTADIGAYETQTGSVDTIFMDGFNL